MKRENIFLTFKTGLLLATRSRSRLISFIFRLVENTPSVHSRRKFIHKTRNYMSVVREENAYRTTFILENISQHGFFFTQHD